MKVKEVVDPLPLQVALLEEICGRLADVDDKLTKILAFNSFMGPMTRRFKREQQYQYATVNAGASGRVWFMRNPQPDLLVGVLTEVGNSWYTDTYLEWKTDYEAQRVDYEVGTVNEPKKFIRGIPFNREVEWIAYNNDDVNHVFEVLCNGFFIQRTLFDRISGGVYG